MRKTNKKSFSICDLKIHSTFLCTFFGFFKDSDIGRKKK